MFDQLFGPDNFRKIYDLENRRGHDVAQHFFPALNAHTDAIRAKVQEIRDLRKVPTASRSSSFPDDLKRLKDELSNLKVAKNHALDEELEKVSARALSANFKLTLSKGTAPGVKDTYQVEDTPEAFFVIKQLQHNLYRLYGVKQAARHDLTRQLRDTIQSPFVFELVKTDLSTFYESIDRQRLLTKLTEDQLLSSSSLRYIRQLLDAYGAIAKTPAGIPRGVGVSAYLGELYLRPLDREVKEIKGLVLYCRYVDDIIAVFARPPTGENLGSYKDSIVKAIGSRGLSANPTKTEEIKTGKGASATFEYLGYKFKLEGSRCLIWPSARKAAKYQARLEASFNEYHRSAAIGSRNAYRQLVSRVKFLTGNTRLSNSKSTAVTGVYYSNPLVDQLSTFEDLDKALKKQIAKVKRAKLRTRLKKYKFRDGFLERRFHNFSPRELAMIVRVWKHGPA